MGNRPLHVTTICYGSGYSLLTTDFMWPSLVKHSPKAFIGRKVSHRIYCRPDDAWNVAIVNHCQRLQACGVHTYINTKILPNFPLPPYDNANSSRLRNNYVWICLADAMGQAIRENAIMVYALPDHLYGHGLFNLLDNMGDAKYCVCCHLRVTADSSVAEIRDRFNGNGFKDNSEMVDFCFGPHRHPLVDAGFDRTRIQNCWRAEDKGDYYAVWFRDPVPVLIDPTDDMVNFVVSGGYRGTPRFELFDSDLVDWSLANGILKWAKDTNEFFWTELTCKDSYAPQTLPLGFTEPMTDSGRLFFHGEPFKYWKGKS